MKRLSLLIAPLALIAATPALACSYAQAPEDVGDTSAQFLARQMTQAATYVDLVLVNGGNGNRQGTLPEKSR